eukprot:m.111032 g.111032  ORF g.111032 m.111032 type:complete len:52 (+) comp37417_c0_seq11:1832-1987(+)
MYKQVYPTPMRAIGLGMCSSMSRIGAMVTPFIAQVVDSCFSLLEIDRFGGG